MSHRPALPRTGYLLVGHGTRDTTGQAEFHATVQLVAAACPAAIVQPCFLELVEPSISAAIERLAEAGVERVVVAPLLLFAAGHAKRDVPEAIDAAARRFPRMRFVQATHLGCHDDLLELSARRFRDAAPVLEPPARPADPPASLASQTLWIMVGRGSLDAEATAEFERFTELRRARTPVAAVWNAYLAMAKPSLREVLAQAEAAEYARVVVQPHLLFSGELLEVARELARSSARRTPDREWRFASHLGPDKLVAAALVGRCRQAERQAWPLHDCGSRNGEE